MSQKHTPKRESLSSKNTQFTPILVPESPGAQTAHRNITGYARVVRDLVADIFNEIQRWNGLHIRGAQIVKQIASLKSDHIKDKEYPAELEGYCNIVFEVVESLEIISENLKSISKKIAALTNVHKTDTPLFITWPVSKFVDKSNQISSAYEIEYKLKRTVCENIAHSRSKEEVLFQATCWAVQPYIDSEVKLALESMLLETGHRKIQ